MGVFLILNGQLTLALMFDSFIIFILKLPISHSIDKFLIKLMKSLAIKTKI
jgi:hypothetical protein